MSDEMVVRNGQELTRIDPRAAVAARNIDDVHRMATAIAKTGLYGVKSVDEAMIRIATGMELGLSMMQSIRGVFVISTGGKNMPGLYADIMVGVCKSRNDVCEHFRLVESTAEKATYTTKRKGEPGETTMTFTVDDARKANLLGKGPWEQYRPAMLRARASSALARAVYPDLLNGLYSMEELQDMPGAQSMPAPRVEMVTADGELVSQDLDAELHASIEAEQARLFESLMVSLLDARGPKGFDAALAAIGAAKEKLSSEQLDKLRSAAREAKKMLQPEAPAA